MLCRISWLSDNFLTPGSQFHESIVNATAEEADALPTADTLLFGRGTQVLKDTRFGEYQTGMTLTISRQVQIGMEQGCLSMGWHWMGWDGVRWGQQRYGTAIRRLRMRKGAPFIGRDPIHR